MENTANKTTEIRISVGLDAENVPVSIAWTADDAPEGKEMQASKVMLLSLYDPERMDTLKIDLWTKDLQVGEMDRMMYQTLRGLTDTYFRATQNRELAVEMQQFVQYFGEKTEILPQSK
jgi:gliding motility-associated protein GldC